MIRVSFSMKKNQISKMHYINRCEGCGEFFHRSKENDGSLFYCKEECKPKKDEYDIEMIKW